MTLVGTKIFAHSCGGLSYCVLNLEGLLREVGMVAVATAMLW